VSVCVSGTWLPENGMALTCKFVGPVGFEPTTYGLKVRSSAIELEARRAPCGDALVARERAQL
jgi:hypothetical protein